MKEKKEINEREREREREIERERERDVLGKENVIEPV